MNYNEIPLSLCAQRPSDGNEVLPPKSAGCNGFRGEKKKLLPLLKYIGIYWPVATQDFNT